MLNLYNRTILQYCHHIPRFQYLTNKLLIADRNNGQKYQNRTQNVLKKYISSLIARLCNFLKENVK